MKIRTQDAKRAGSGNTCLFFTVRIIYIYISIYVVTPKSSAHFFNKRWTFDHVLGVFGPCSNAGTPSGAKVTAAFHIEVTAALYIGVTAALHREVTLKPHQS